MSRPEEGAHLVAGVRPHVPVSQDVRTPQLVVVLPLDLDLRRVPSHHVRVLRPSTIITIHIIFAANLLELGQIVSISKYRDIKVSDFQSID